MIPLTGTVNELKWIQPQLERIAKEVMAEKGKQIDYKFGTMIEIPRAASPRPRSPGWPSSSRFGTNDLTQMTFGYSRDDAERNFLLKYVEDGILPKNPFQTIDRDGVGELMEICVRAGPQGPPGPRSRHLRRARRRPRLDRVVPPDRPQLRELLAVPRAGGPSGRGAGGDQARAGEGVNW